MSPRALLADILLELADVLNMDGLTQGEPDQAVQVFVSERGQGLLLPYGGTVFVLSVREMKAQANVGQLILTDGDKQEVRRELMQALKRK